MKKPICSQSEYDAYEYSVDTEMETDGRYRGKILVRRRGDTLAALVPPFLILTPGVFKSCRSAQIEATSYAQVLIYTGSINTMLDDALRN